ncbi:MAG TPA: hypothetical protein C5S37_01990, partial [Methanophagales archaeon]|nr:hypothetical protein [Methanophagales archaeon]
KINIFNLFYKPFTASIIMGISIYAVKSYIQGWSNMHQIIIVVPLAAVIYMLALIVFKAFTEEDIKKN